MGIAEKKHKEASQQTECVTLMNPITPVVDKDVLRKYLCGCIKSAAVYSFGQYHTAQPVQLQQEKIYLGYKEEKQANTRLAVIDDDTYSTTLGD